VKVRPGTIYRISLDARGPEGGAADYLRAELYTPDQDLPWPVKNLLGLMAYPDQIGQDWRHFEWTFRTPLDIDANTIFRIYTQSERPIEVRGVDFHESHWDRPREYPYGNGKAGELYFLRAELASRKPGDEPVAIYQNLGLNYWPKAARTEAMNSKDIEHAKWQNYVPHELADDIPHGTWRLEDYDYDPLPAIGVKVECHPTRMLFGTAAGGILYLIVLAALGFAAAARRRE
jgi:hypothetical protein